MKKKLSILLILAMVISLGGCNSGATKLTLDNYAKFLDVEVWCPFENEYQVQSSLMGQTQIIDYYTSVCGTIKTKGLSQNFNYENITITVKITGETPCIKRSRVANQLDIKRSDIEYEEFEITVVLTDTDITGEGIGEKEYDLPSDKMTKNFEERSYFFDAQKSYTYEIIEISGKVSPI